MTSAPPCFALVAGEASGDQLGAALIRRLKESHPHARFVGVGGRLMREQGMETWWDCEELAVFGLFEVLSHFPRLLKLRNALVRRLLDTKPDVFIGIDAPDFNLGLEIKLRKRGIRTVQYVSPTVWAWREKRVRKIARAADRVLCLFPFEPAFYDKHGVDARYVGHPLADQISLDNPPAPARQELGLDDDSTIITLLPGSRMGEVSRLAGPMIEAARLLKQQRGNLQFIAALANEKTLFAFREAMETAGFMDVELYTHQAKEAMAAADVVVCASGTATLETLLINRPMVVVYKLAPATYRLALHLKLIKPQHVALPNILAGESLVPELIQDDASAESIAREISNWLNSPQEKERLSARFDALHEELRCQAGRQAALAVLDLLEPATPAP